MLILDPKQQNLLKNLNKNPTTLFSNNNYMQDTNYSFLQQGQGNLTDNKSPHKLSNLKVDQSHL